MPNPKAPSRILGAEDSKHVAFNKVQNASQLHLQECLWRVYRVVPRAEGCLALVECASLLRKAKGMLVFLFLHHWMFFPN